MNCYVTSRFKNAVDHKPSILALCAAVREAGFEDVSFIRDIEQFDPHHFTTQQEVWRASLKLLQHCDSILIDVSDTPTGGRNVEVGMAYALDIPIFVIVQRDVTYKSFYDGLATKVIPYDTFADVTRELATWISSETSEV